MKSKKLTALVLSVLVASGATSAILTEKNIVQAKEVKISSVQSKIATNIGIGEESWGSTVFAPYVDACSYPVFSLTEYAKETGTKHFILGFVVDKNGQPSWGTYYDMEEGPTDYQGGGLLKEIKALRQMGGDVMVSFGGEANTPLAASIKDVNKLKDAYKKVIKDYGLTHIDFDIEGAWTADAASIERRSQAIALLQKELKAENHPLKIWYTLPVLPSGMTNGVDVVKNAVKNGVELSGVNVMTMCFGQKAPDGTMGDLVVESAKSVHKQLKDIYTQANIQKSDKEIWKMIGVTPMNGLDYSGSILDQNGARKVASFGKTVGMGLIGMWSVNRDYQNSKGSTNYVSITDSSILQEKFEFGKILSNYDSNDGSGIIEKPGTTDPENPGDGEGGGEVEGVPAYKPQQEYSAGDKVSYKGKIYQAKWWTKGFAPDTAVQNSWDTPWELIGNSDDGKDVEDGKDAEDGKDVEDGGEVGSAPAYNLQQEYWGGDKVSYKGKVYQAKWWTKGFAPDTVVENTWDTPWELIG
ncbi:chitinase [Clostridium botulinum]|uniref:chitinase n=1 Tax=Clostridium botulinum TaxID=1491 RepID=UPI001FD68012|nr:chitinase [Clostridium botulinum]MCJ8171580.1 chitinase [Clostridium botulinum]